MGIFTELGTAWDFARDKVDDYWDKGKEKVEDVTEYFFDDDDAQANEVSGLPGAPADGKTFPGQGGLNWTAVGALVGAAGIALKVLRK